METALALIYVLLHIVSPSTSSFTLRATPDTAFHITRAEQGDWTATLIGKTGEKPYGTIKVEGRDLKVTAAEGTMKFPAADRLGLPQAPDWGSVDRIGKGEIQWTLQRLPKSVEFTLHIAGKEHPQKIVATLDSIAAK